MREDSRLISTVGMSSSADVIIGDVIMGLSAGAENEEIDVLKPRDCKVSVCRNGEHLRIVRDGVMQHFLVRTIDRAGVVNHEEYVVADAHGTQMLPCTEVITASAEADAGGSGVIRVPTPGATIVLSVEKGARVEVGDALLVMEAMKMEHTLTAEIAGRVGFTVTPGDQATGDQ